MESDNQDAKDDYDYEIETKEQNINTSIELENNKHKFEILNRKEQFSRSLTFYKKDLIQQKIRDKQKKLMKELKKVKEGGNEAFHPSSSSMQLWYMVVIIGILFTAIVTPYEMAFLETHFNGLFWINRLVDLIFLVDIIVQFFTAIKIQTKNSTVWIVDKKVIARHYLRTWFVLDVISIFPFDIIGLAIGSHNLKRVKIVRILRLIRLFKISNILQASSLFEKIESGFSINYSILGLAQFISLMLITGHWLACLWGFVGMEVKRNGDYSWIDYVIDSKHGNYNIQFNVYIAALYWSFMTLVTVGYGDVVPQNIPEMIVCNICMVTGGLIWAYIIGATCGVLSRFAEENAELRKEINEFNRFAAENNLPREMQSRIRRFMYHSSHLKKLRTYQDLICELSPTLQGEVAVKLNDSLLSKVWYLKKSEAKFKIELAKKFVCAVFAPQELLDNLGTLFILSKGVVTRKGKIFTLGSIWGEDFILDSWLLVDKTAAVAINYAEVMMLSREDMDSTLQNFPTSSRIVRDAAIRTALLRQIVLLSNRTKRKIDNDPSSDPIEVLKVVISGFKNLFTKDMLSKYNAVEIPEERQVAITGLAGDMKELQSKVEKLSKYFDVFRSEKD